MLVTCGFSINFNYPWYDFSQMADIIATLGLETALQNWKIPSISCALVIGLKSRLMKSWIEKIVQFTLSNKVHTLSSCYKFSNGLASGPSGGVRHQFMLFSSKNSLLWCEVCLGSLSCMNLWLSGYAPFMKGTKNCQGC